jgi:hypothetical protein
VDFEQGISSPVMRATPTVPPCPHVKT